MRHVILGFALVLVVGGTAFAQEPAALDVVQACKIKPGETGALVAAFREFAAYARTNTPDLPGARHGSFIQRYTGGQNFVSVYEMASAGEYEEFTAARREVIQSNARWENCGGRGGPTSCPNPVRCRSTTALRLKTA